MGSGRPRRVAWRGGGRGRGSFRRIALSGGASFDRSTIRLSQQFRISASDEVVSWIDAFATRGVIGSIPPEALDARVSDGEGQYQRCTGRGCPLPGIAARAQGDYVVVEHHVLLARLPVPQLLNVKTPPWRSPMTNTAMLSLSGWLPRVLRVPPCRPQKRLGTICPFDFGGR